MSILAALPDGHELAIACGLRALNVTGQRCSYNERPRVSHCLHETLQPRSRCRIYDIRRDPCCRPHRHRTATAAQEAAELGAPVLPPVGSDRQLEIEENWLADMVEAWQDDEWQVQANHRDLGVAVGRAYRAVRSTGEDDLGTILLSIAADLEAFPFHDTFTGNFEVANKAIELLMFNEGQEVCCTNESDARRLETLGTAKLRQAEAENESA